MVARLILLSIALLLCSSDTYAHVHIWIETPHDELGARRDCEQREDIAKRQVMLARLERRLLEGVESKEELVAKYGAPKPLNIANFVRPLGANLVVALENVAPSEIDGVMERALYFELNNTCGLLVLVNLNGEPYLPGILLWKIDDLLPKMKGVGLCDKRLLWESARLDSVLKIAGVAESDLTPTPEEMKRIQESAVSKQNYIDQLRRRKR